MNDELRGIARDLATAFLELKQATAQDRSAETTHSPSEILAVDALFAEGDRLLAELASLEPRAGTDADLDALSEKLSRLADLLALIQAQHCGHEGGGS